MSHRTKQEIDSSDWKSWDCTLQVADMVMEGALYLFGEGDEIRGIMDFMGTSAKEAHGGTLLAVVEPVQKLLDSATKK